MFHSLGGSRTLWSNIDRPAHCYYLTNLNKLVYLPQEIELVLKNRCDSDSGSGSTLCEHDID